MGGRRQCIAAARIPKFVRAQLNELRGIGVIDYARGVYHISEIALYSSCQLSALVAAPPRGRIQVASRGNRTDL